MWTKKSLPADRNEKRIRIGGRKAVVGFLLMTMAAVLLLLAIRYLFL